MGSFMLIRSRCARVLAGSFVFALGLSAVAAGAEEPFADPELAALLPGQVLADEELQEIHGKGMTITVGGSLSFDEVPFMKPPNLRKSIMGGMKSAGVRPSLNPAGPNGIAGGGAIPIPQMPKMTIRVPMPRFGGSGGSGSSSMSGSGS